MRWSLVASIVLLTLAVTAPANAGTATLWACHGPTGAALGSTPIQTTGTISGGCNLPGSSLRASSFALDTPSGTTLSAVRIGRRAQGPGYVAKVDATELEREDAGAVLDGELSKPATGFGVRLSGGTIDLRYAALTVTDNKAPSVAVGGLRNPAQGVLTLDINATDDGLGLAGASATLDGKPAGSVQFGTCAELSPADATIDRALGADCPPFVPHEPLAVDTTQVPDGNHELVVTVTDAAGNSTPVIWAFEVLNHINPGSSTGTIEIGNGIPTPTPSATPTPTPTASPAPQAAVATPTPTPIARPVIPAAARTPSTRERVKIPTKLKVARNGTITLRVLCPATSAKPCDLRLKLTQGRTTIASAKGSAKPGKSAKLVLKLSRSALRTLARRHKLDATLTLAGATPATVRLRQ